MAEWTAKCPRRTGNTGIERVRPAAARSDPAQHQTQSRVSVTVDHFGAVRGTATESPPLAYPAASCPAQPGRLAVAGLHPAVQRQLLKLGNTRGNPALVIDQGSDPVIGAADHP